MENILAKSSFTNKLPKGIVEMTIYGFVCLINHSKNNNIENYSEPCYVYWYADRDIK